MSYKSVALVGASGNLGKLTIPILLGSTLEVTAVVRTASSATFPAGIGLVKTDFTLASLTEAFRGKDAVISMLPIVALADQAVVIEAAIAAGVKRFLPSEYGSDTSSKAVIAAVPFFAAKEQYLDYLRSKEDTISWTALITGPFFDWGLPLGFWGFDLNSRTAQLIDDGEVRFTTSNVSQIGRALISILDHPVETANKLVFVESFTTTQREVLAYLEKATGSQWLITHSSSDELRTDAAKLIGQGNITDGGAKLIGALVLGKPGLEDHTHLGVAEWNKRLSLPQESIDATVRRVLKQAE